MKIYRFRVFYKNLRRWRHVASHDVFSRRDVIWRIFPKSGQNSLTSMVMTSWIINELIQKSYIFLKSHLSRYYLSDKHFLKQSAFSLFSQIKNIPVFTILDSKIDDVTTWNCWRRQKNDVIWKVLLFYESWHVREHACPLLQSGDNFSEF